MRLRRGAEVAPSVRRFLDERFRDGEDLRGAAALQAELQGRCSDLEAAVVDLDSRLRQQLAAYALHSDAVVELLGKVRAGLFKLGSSAAGSSPGPTPSPIPSSLLRSSAFHHRFHPLECFDLTDGGFRGGTKEGSTRGDQITADALLALAREVARVETVRTYAGENPNQIPPIIRPLRRILISWRLRSMFLARSVSSNSDNWPHHATDLSVTKSVATTIFCESGVLEELHLVYSMGRFRRGKIRSHTAFELFSS